MTAKAVRVESGSRLHFGMFSFGQPGIRAFGGVGLLVDEPRLELHVQSSTRFEAHGPHADRVYEFARRWAAASGLSEEPACRVQVIAAPPAHAGLGSGTQLGLAVAAALSQWERGAPEDVLALARRVGRGQRSAVGIHAFARGGLIVEAGKRTPEAISPCVARCELPAAWRFVLLLPERERGLSGTAEREAFARLPAVSPEQTARMSEIVLLELLPAVAEADVARFGRALYRFGVGAGECFAAAQQGAFASKQVASRVRLLRGWGLEGVGQSSWGPTVFALCGSEDEARGVCQRLLGHAEAVGCRIIVATPLACGARVTVTP